MSLENVACLGRNVDDIFTLASLGRFLDEDQDFNLSVNYCLTLERFLKNTCLSTTNIALNLETLTNSLSLIKFNTLIAALDIISANLFVYLVNYRLELTRYPVFLSLIKPLDFLLVERVLISIELMLVKEHELQLTETGLIFELTRRKCLH